MKTIIFKLICIGLFILLIPLGAGYLVYCNIKGDFEYSKLVNYKLTLLKKAVSPRIIVIGGSNTIYGIDCKKLSDITGYRVVNLGFISYIGIRFNLESLSPYLANGDIVLVSPEYENFFNDKIYYGNDTVAFLATQNIKSLSSYYLSSWQQLYSIFWRLPHVAFKHFFIHDLFGRSTVTEPNYNEFGDMQIKEVSFAGKPFNEKAIISPHLTFNGKALKDLVRYQELAIAKGARFLIAYPFIPEETYKINRTKLDDVHNRLKTSGLKIMAPPADSFAAKIYFNDSYYHPNPIGRVIRTDAIIHGINKCINEQNKGRPPVGSAL